MSQKHRVVSLAALALFAVACADPVSAPTRALIGAHPSFHATTTPLGAPMRSGLQGGEVEICKTTPVGDPSRNWSYTVVVVTELDNAPAAPAIVPPVNPVVVPADAGQTVCVTAYISTKSGSDLDRVTVTEEVLPLNWVLEDIHIDQYLTGAEYLTPPPGETDVGSIANRQAVMYINDDIGRVVTFQNNFTPDDPPDVGCTYTKGWYQNKNGAPTVISVDSRTKEDAQAIFAATPGKPGGVTFAGPNSLLNLYQQFLAALNNLGGDVNQYAGPDAVDAAIDAVRAGTDGSGLAITTTFTKSQIGHWTGVLAGFNEGDLPGWPHC